MPLSVSAYLTTPVDVMASPASIFSRAAAAEAACLVTPVTALPRLNAAVTEISFLSILCRSTSLHTVRATASAAPAAVASTSKYLRLPSLSSSSSSSSFSLFFSSSSSSIPSWTSASTPNWVSSFNYSSSSSPVSIFSSTLPPPLPPFPFCLPRAAAATSVSSLSVFSTTSPASASPSSSSASQTFSCSSSFAASPALFSSENAFSRIVVIGAGQMGTGIGITIARYMPFSHISMMDMSECQLQQAQTAAAAYFKKEISRGRLSEEEANSCYHRLSFIQLHPTYHKTLPLIPSSSSPSSFPCASPSHSEGFFKAARIQNPPPATPTAAAVVAKPRSSTNTEASSTRLTSHSAAAASLSPAITYSLSKRYPAATTHTLPVAAAAASCAAAVEQQNKHEIKLPYTSPSRTSSTQGSVYTVSETMQQQKKQQQQHEQQQQHDQQQQQQHDQQQQQQHVCVIPAALREATFCIEAVSENLEAKQSLFTYLDVSTPADTILASNTSSISITRLAAATRRPEKVIGMHFMNPVPVMPLVEIIPGLRTSADTLLAADTLAARIKKVTARSLDRPGFIANRLLMPYINEAAFALQEGIGSAEDIDKVMKLGTNVPLGPLELADFIGLDTCLYIMQILHKELGESKYRASPLLVQHVDAGYLGRKTNRGFYSYEKSEKAP